MVNVLSCHAATLCNHLVAYYYATIRLHVKPFFGLWSYAETYGWQVGAVQAARLCLLDVFEFVQVSRCTRIQTHSCSHAVYS